MTEFVNFYIPLVVDNKRHTIYSGGRFFKKIQTILRSVDLYKKAAPRMKNAGSYE